MNPTSSILNSSGNPLLTRSCHTVSLQHIHPIPISLSRSPSLSHVPNALSPCTRSPNKYCGNPHFQQQPFLNFTGSRNSTHLIVLCPRPKHRRQNPNMYGHFPKL